MSQIAASQSVQYAIGKLPSKANSFSRIAAIDVELRTFDVSPENLKLTVGEENMGPMSPIDRTIMWLTKITTWEVLQDQLIIILLVRNPYSVFDVMKLQSWFIKQSKIRILEMKGNCEVIMIHPDSWVKECKTLEKEEKFLMICREAIGQKKLN